MSSILEPPYVSRSKVCKEQGLVEIYGEDLCLRIGKEDNDKKDKKGHTSKK